MFSAVVDAHVPVTVSPLEQTLFVHFPGGLRVQLQVPADGVVTSAVTSRTDFELQIAVTRGASAAAAADERASLRIANAPETQAHVPILVVLRKLKERSF